MSTEPVNTSIVDGVRAYYEQSRVIAAREMPDTPWPAFDDLTGEQVRAWVLAYAATAELSVRMSDAIMALGVTS